MIRDVMGVVEDFGGFIRSKWTWAVAKTWEFIHVKPNSRKLNLLIQGIKHIDPILGRIRIKEINKVRGSRPYSSNKIFSSWRFDINVPLESLIVSVPITNFNSSINDWNVVIIFKDFFHTIQRKSRLINGKIFKVSHVINITPNCIQRKVVICVFLNDGL